MIAIFDIDGTLSNCEHRLHYIKRNKPDWNAFYKACIDDAPIQEMLDLLLMFLEDWAYDVVYITGRSEICRKETIEWFDNHGIIIEDTDLYMRAEGDYRADYIIKWELAQKHLKTKDIALVFEDRKRVVDMWRKNGIRALQVAEGDF
jgi:hypothetical protein